jgi:hypothetical protein
MSRIKLLIVDILQFLSAPNLTYFLAEIIMLTPVLIIRATIFIKKNIIKKINIIA